MQPGARARVEDNPVIIGFTVSREVGNIAWNVPNNIATPARAGTRPSPCPPMAQARRFSCIRELICDIRIGPRENSPTSAFRVSPRK